LQVGNEVVGGQQFRLETLEKVRTSVLVDREGLPSVCHRWPLGSSKGANFVPGSGEAGLKLSEIVREDLNLALPAVRQGVGHEGVDFLLVAGHLQLYGVQAEAGAEQAPLGWADEPGSEPVPPEGDFSAGFIEASLVLLLFVLQELAAEPKVPGVCGLVLAGDKEPKQQNGTDGAPEAEAQEAQEDDHGRHAGGDADKGVVGSEVPNARQNVRHLINSFTGGMV
jgi:hypothetical protein